MATAFDNGDNESIFIRRSQRRKRSMVTFAYDVGVNVLANAIAGAGGILILQATGALKRNPALTRIATSLLVLAIIALVMMLALSILAAYKPEKLAESLGIVVSVGYFIAAMTTAQRLPRWIFIPAAIIIPVGGALIWFRRVSLSPPRPERRRRRHQRWRAAAPVAVVVERFVGRTAVSQSR